MESEFQNYIYISKYSRYLHEEGRREIWPETVKRYFDFFQTHLKDTCDFKINKELRTELETAILSQQVAPSMRCLMTAGKALEKENVAGYNCAYTPVITMDSPKAFAEILYILMCGTGIGYSVEQQYVGKLPFIPDELYPTDTTIIVKDSKLGWAKALSELVSLLYSGLIPQWDTTKLRPAGSVLKTFGGRASGPEPLERLFKFIIDTFTKNKGQRLSTVDCHDICCNIGECVVVGGVRRSAEISLSDLSDDRMRSAKTGQWWKLTPWRSIANNSAVYHEKQPPMGTFLSEWKSLYDSKSGERGIFSRYAARNVIERSNHFRVEHFGKEARLRDLDYEWGCNPCSEIILRPSQFCNLTEVIVRAWDTEETLKEKVRVAAILGTFQSTLTNFKFLSKIWRQNTEDERLLGVSLTGIMDCPLTNGMNGAPQLSSLLTDLRKIVIATNIEFAKLLGIPVSTACTSVKPSGTVSSLVDSASGIHARHAPFYLRAVRSDKKDPVGQLMIEQGFPYEDDAMHPEHNWVFYFPMKSPEGAVVRSDISAVRHLEIWKIYQRYWTDHKPSITVSVKEDEWMQVGNWVYSNFEWVSGISFLPFADHNYVQAPFQEITEEDYKEWMKKTPEKVNWSLLSEFEKNDQTTGTREFACVASQCEI